MKRFRHLVEVLALITVVFASPAQAGNRAQIIFSANPVTVGNTYTVRLSHFRANTWVTVGAYYLPVNSYCGGVTDSAGTFACTMTALSAGSIEHEAKEQQRTKLRVRAEAFLQVNP
jgi:hypothetical protein